jgi:hypothetical protein
VRADHVQALNNIIDFASLPMGLQFYYSVLEAFGNVQGSSRAGKQLVDPCLYTICRPPKRLWVRAGIRVLLTILLSALAS